MSLVAKLLRRSSPSATAEQSSSGDIRVYTPYQSGLPNLRQYFTELWQYRDFAKELSDTNIRAGHTNTMLGQLWLIVNPLLLAAVYLLLIFVLSGSGKGADFPQITSGLFLFFLVSGAITACATSVTNAGSLILNMSFPKQLVIVSNVYLALRRFVPTFGVYVIIHLMWGRPLTWHLLWIPYIVALALLVSIGLGSAIATMHVYFRDTAQFLPYFIRIWLYVSPVLYTGEMFRESGMGRRLGDLVYVNPVFAILSCWASVLHGESPTLKDAVIATVVAVSVAILGVQYFLRREREFAVRL